jgi:aminomethyltransferase
MNKESYEALRERAAWFDCSGRGKIRVSGEDRARLLHAMTTNHIQGLQPGDGCYAFFLTAQGRILADAHILCLDDSLLINTEPETRQRVYEHLDKYIIADDAVVEDLTDKFATVQVEGPGARKVVSGLAAPAPEKKYGIAAWQGGWVEHASETGLDGFALMVPVEEKAALLATLAAAGVPEADPEAVDAVRHEAGKPRYGVDFSESSLPQETQLQDALHFSKGCYLGQEIVERIRSRGHVNKQLTPLVIAMTEAPAPGTKILADAKEVGEITSAAYSPANGNVSAFAILRTEALRPGAVFSIDGATGSARTM